MTRQQSITLDQVECKIYDAHRRAGSAVDAASSATTQEAYNKAIKDGLKAASDWQTWYRVKESLLKQ